MSGIKNTPKIPDWYKELDDAGKRSAIKRFRIEDNGVLFAIAMDEEEAPALRTLAVLGSMMKHGGADARQAADLLHELYKAGCHKDAIRKFNGTVLSHGYKGSTDDDNCGYSTSDEKFIVW